jgi:hypothetical protein
MKRELVHGGNIGVGLLVLSLTVWPAQGAQSGSGLVAASRTADPMTGADQTKSDVAATTMKHSSGVDDVLRMVRAGVSWDVIRTFVENSAVAFNLSADDIITLKKSSVPDDITTAMIKRGAMLRQQASQARNAISTVLLRSNQRQDALDPESYEYFQYYYLHPRALAAANEQLLSPYIGFYGPGPFHPLSPFRFQGP